MQWDDARIFLAIARAGSLSGASAALGLGVATVSRRLDRLESALAMPLFSRHQSGYRLTADGQALLAPAEALEQAAQAVDAAAHSQAQVAGVVRLATADHLIELFALRRAELEGRARVRALAARRAKHARTDCKKERTFMHRHSHRHCRLLPWLGALAATLALAACADRPKAPTGPQAPPGAAAAVYSLLFLDNASNLGPKAAAYCIGNGRGWALLDPDAGTLALFNGQTQVQPASACDVGKGGEQVLDRASGRPALMFGVELVHCTATGSECLIRGSYYEGPSNAQSNLYNARQRGGSWQAVMALRGPAP